MGKLLLLLLLIVGGYLILRSMKTPSDRDRPPPAGPAGERMVTCARCGLHLPLSDSIESAGRFFCSEEHRRLGG